MVCQRPSQHRLTAKAEHTSPLISRSYHSQASIIATLHLCSVAVTCIGQSHGPTPPCCPAAGLCRQKKRILFERISLPLRLIPCFACCRPLQAEEEDILREALLASGTDPEAPVDSSRKRRRSWYSLLGTAITYVWPDSPILQLRAFSCIFLILIMRVLNLAVPILYKKVVDTLASTSEGTHPRPGEEREYYQFWQVCFRRQCSAHQGSKPGLLLLGGRA